MEVRGIDGTLGAGDALIPKGSYRFAREDGRLGAAQSASDLNFR